MGAAGGDRGCRRWGECGRWEAVVAPGVVRGAGAEVLMRLLDGQVPPVVVVGAGSVVGEPFALLSLPCVRAHV